MKTQSDWKKEKQQWLDEQAKLWEAANPMPLIPESLNGNKLTIGVGHVKVGCVTVSENLIEAILEAVREKSKAFKDRWKLVYLGTKEAEFFDNASKFGGDVPFGVNNHSKDGYTREEAEEMLKERKITKPDNIYIIMPFEKTNAKDYFNG